MKDVNRSNFKLRNRANFIILPVGSVFDERLKKVDFNILAYLSLMQGNSDGCWVTIGFICNLLGLDINSKKGYIKKRISHLEELGYIKRIQRFSKYHQSNFNFYQVLFKDPPFLPEIDLEELNKYSLEKEEFDEEFKARKRKKRYNLKKGPEKNTFLNEIIEETIKINPNFRYFYENVNLQRPIHGKLFVNTSNEFTKDYFMKKFSRDMLRACGNLNFSINTIEIGVENGEYI